MVTQNTNPFVLPGFGQSGEMAQNPMLASMEMMRKAWEDLAGGGGFDQALAASGMSPEDLERRIADLRAVENWLRMNLTMLSSTVQALEVQRATMSTLQSFLASAASASGGAAHGGPSPLDVALGLRPGGDGGHTPASGDSSGLFGPRTGATQAASEGQADAQAQSSPSPGAAGASATSAQAPAPNPGEAAMHTWWDMLQAQFDNLASAAAATMQGAEAMQEAATAAQQQAVDAAQAAVSGATRPAGATPSAGKTSTARKAPASKSDTAAAAKSAQSAKPANKTAAKKTAARKTSAKKAATTRSTAARKP